jgi:hypothetical protein
MAAELEPSAVLIKRLQRRLNKMFRARLRFYSASRKHCLEDSRAAFTDVLGSQGTKSNPSGRRA